MQPGQRDVRVPRRCLKTLHRGDELKEDDRPPRGVEAPAQGSILPYKPVGFLHSITSIGGFSGPERGAAVSAREQAHFTKKHRNYTHKTP